MILNRNKLEEEEDKQKKNKMINQLSKAELQKKISKKQMKIIKIKNKNKGNCLQHVYIKQKIFKKKKIKILINKIKMNMMIQIQ